MEILSIWTYRSYIIGRFKPTDWVVIKDWIGRFKPIDYIRSISEIDKMSIFNRSKQTIDYKHVDTAESVGIQPIDYDYIWCKKERKPNPSYARNSLMVSNIYTESKKLRHRRRQQRIRLVGLLSWMKSIDFSTDCVQSIDFNCLAFYLSLGLNLSI